MTFSHPDWIKYPGIEEIKPITWKPNLEFVSVALEECFVGEHMVAWLERRPHYCDRGHWQINSDLPGLDSHDSFPRYYMSYEIAKAETEAWLEWRLWKIRHEPKKR